MIQAITIPDIPTILRTVIACVAFLYIPGRAVLTRSLSGFKPKNVEELFESVFLSVLILSLIGMALVFTVGLNEGTLLLAYALGGVLIWKQKKS